MSVMSVSLLLAPLWIVARFRRSPFLASRGMKTCPRCGQTLSLDQYWRDGRTKSGYAVYCIPCGTKRNAAKYRARAQREGRETRTWRPLAATLPGGQRQCQRCREVLPLESFVKNAAKAGGFGSYCKPCHIDIQGEREMDRLPSHGEQVRQRRAAAPGRIGSTACASASGENGMAEISLAAGCRGRSVRRAARRSPSS